MDRPATRLFHLHFNTPDVPAAERALADLGLPLRRRFGRVDEETVSLAPEEPVPDEFRLRLQTHRRGYVDLTVAPGGRHRFDHLGLCTARFDEIIERADAAGWSVRDPDGRRPFVTTPWRFRVELHRDGSDVETALGDWEAAHLTAVELRAPEPDAVHAGLSAVFGDVPGLEVAAGTGERASVSRFRAAGTAFPEGLAVETDAILGG